MLPTAICEPLKWSLASCAGEVVVHWPGRKSIVKAEP
jgi:hypothetical protein